MTGNRKTEQPSGRHPGDEARPGSPQTGDQICPDCRGSGQLAGEAGKEACPSCGGTGRITVIVGDA